MRTITITLPTIEGVEFEIIQHEETIPVRGNALASGDDKWDKKIEDKILNRLECGDLWAWCCVEVKCSWRGLEASDYLGGCSYRNQKDFEKGGYFQDMKDQAYNSLLKQIEKLAEIKTLLT